MVLLITLTRDHLRACFINASRRERGDIALPDLEAVTWNDLDYLGWRDSKRSRLGYVVAEVAGEPIGVLMRQSEQGARRRTQCSWCEDVQLPNEVVFFAAQRAGAAGRKGDSVGTLVCSTFECSTNVRRRPPLAYAGFDRDAEIERRIAVLRQHVSDFVCRVRE